MNKVVAIVTGPVQACGIKVHADKMFNILQHSTKYDFKLITAENKKEFFEKIKLLNLKAIIYNWHDTTLNWLTSDIIKRIKIPQIQIIGHGLIHKEIQFKGIRDYIGVSPVIKKEANIHPGLRPILFYPELNYRSASSPLKIGTSGFGHDGKNLFKLIQYINNQFTEKVILNIHFSIGKFTSRPTLTSLNQLLKTSTRHKNQNIEINLCTDLLGDRKLIELLNNNDINIFYYPPSQACNGVSGAIDAALAARKPIGVNNANFFKHIYSKEIDLDLTPIKKIIEKGTTPLEHFYNLWNKETFLNQYEELLDNYV